MKIQYLGTAAAEGWPGLFCNCEYCKKAKQLGGKNIRTRSQAIIDDTLLMDFPPDSYAHMLQYGVDLPSIHSLLITHTHQDHFYPEDLGLRTPPFSQLPNGRLTLYGNKEALRKCTAMYGEHMSRYKEILAVQYIEPYTQKEIEGYIVTPLLANHDKAEDCYIYHIEKNNTAILYGNDTGIFPNDTWAFLQNKKLNLVSLDCTHQAYAEGTNHMGIPDVVHTMEKLAQNNCILPNSKCVITHFSHNGHMLHHELEEEAAKHNITVAFDSLSMVF